MNMPSLEFFAIAVIGLCVVIGILAIIAVLILLLSKIVRAVETAVANKTSASSAAPAASPAAQPAPDGINGGEVELIGTDEKTAAVVMAIVSQQSGIPLNRLSFKSIRLLDDKKKGDGAK